uniref:non-specific serine/threonine protein kinase n=1 Tax=Fagus sylvatica TaxID=28930 RepID=A0A2N9FDD8_FAGSY
MKLHQTILYAFWPIYLQVILLVSINLLCLLQPTTANAPTNETDRLALLKIKESIAHDPYMMLSSWNDSTHFCNWFGITCGRRHQRVTALDLQGYKLRGSISPYISNLTFLKFFNLQNNSFYGEIPHEVGHLYRLQGLYLNNNTLEGEILSSLSNCSNARFITLHVNELSGKIPAELGSLMKLEMFRLGANNLTGEIPTSLGNLSSLRIFSLQYNNLVGHVPNGIVNEISGTIPATLGNLVNLIVLGTEHNRFTGLIPTSFEKFRKIQELGLSENRLSGEIPTFIGNLTQLFLLGLSENKLEGSIPPSIGNCQNLQYLDISQNSLSGLIPQQIISLSSLSVLLNMSHNSFTGKLPFEVGNLKNINSLDISENNLSGEIPSSIGNCLSLEYLSLQGNSFEGSIPTSMVSLKGLQFLDVSRNNLSGSIPKGLETLPYLQKLNLSFNDIEGEVPTKGIFKNASAISVIGNTKLCGGLPQLQLPPCPVKIMKPRKSLSFNLTIVIVVGVLCFLLFSFFLVLYWRRKSKRNSSSLVSTIDLLPSVSYKMLYRATNEFSPSNLIGSGSFGSVYKGVLHPEERLVAVKVLNLQRKGASKSFKVECNVLRNIRHRNLVKILTCCSSMDYSGNQFKALVFEFITNGSLDIWLHPEIDNEDQSRVLSLLQRLNVAIDVASALDYLHNHSMQPIIHCDLKPSNILLDNDMVAHVCDFGLARLLSIITNSSQKQTSTIGIKGSIGYVAPEYGMGSEPSTEGDVYSYGVLLLEMFLGKRPTDEMFKDDLNLHNFVKMALPDRLVQIVDPTLLPKEVEETPATTVVAREDNNENEIEIEEDEETQVFRQVEANVYKCLVSVLEIGLACSVESPKERMNMEEVTKELHLIKNTFLGSRI